MKQTGLGFGNPHGKNTQGTTHRSTSKTLLLITLTLIILTVIPLYFPFNKFPYLSSSNHPSSTSPDTISPANHPHDQLITIDDNHHKCDVFSGEWVPNPNAPYYHNTTCWAIHEHQNCQKYGRPDSDYMKWKWKPDECDLPVFNPYQFLEIVRDKALAFVGDSVGRNQMQSLICMLSRVEYPIDVSTTKDENFKRWYYESYNFTLATYWSPFLVKFKEPSTDDPTLAGVFSLYLDEFDNAWTNHIDDFNYLIINGGHWFSRPSLYYEKGQIIGCKYCQKDNITDYPMTFGYHRAFRTAYKAIMSRKNFKGVAMLRTFAPTHFEGGDWNKGGDCPRKKPFKSNEIRLEGSNLEMYLSQMEEFKWAEKKAKDNGLKLRLLDITQPMLLRPDGHPSKFGHWPNENVALYNDCVHWCLPGPIDTWSDFLLHMLKMEGRRSAEGKLYSKLGENEIKKNKYVETLRNTSLLFPDLCAQLFDGVMTNGIKSLEPISAEPITAIVVKDDEEIEIPKDTTDSLSSSSSDPPPPPPVKKKQKMSKKSIDEEILGVLKIIADKMSKSETPPKPTFEECEKKLKKLGWSEDDPLHVVACAIFCEENDNYKECWMKLNPKMCANWVKMIGRSKGFI